MAKNELTINVNVKLFVDPDTAVTCLRIAAIYANARNLTIDKYRADNGEWNYFFNTCPLGGDDNGKAD